MSKALLAAAAGAGEAELQGELYRNISIGFRSSYVIFDQFSI